MSDIGIRELKARASEIIRSVRERRARYLITYRGRPVAALIPLEGSQGPVVLEGESGTWERLTQIGEEIGQGWQSPQSSTELLSESRR